MCCSFSQFFPFALCYCCFIALILRRCIGSLQTTRRNQKAKWDWSKLISDLNWATQICFSSMRQQRVSQKKQNHLPSTYQMGCILFHHCFERVKIREGLKSSVVTCVWSKENKLVNVQQHQKCHSHPEATSPIKTGRCEFCKIHEPITNGAGKVWNKNSRILDVRLCMCGSVCATCCHSWCFLLLYQHRGISLCRKAFLVASFYFHIDDKDIRDVKKNTNKLKM